MNDANSYIQLLSDMSKGMQLNVRKPAFVAQRFRFLEPRVFEEAPECVSAALGVWERR